MGIKTALFALCFLVYSQSLHALEFELNKTGNALVDESIANALDTWKVYLANNVTVHLRVELVQLEGYAVAHAEAEYYETTYVAFVSALGRNITSEADTIFYGRLSQQSTYSKLINGTKEFSTTKHNRNYKLQGLKKLEMTRANSKVLGLVVANDKSTDATIKINVHAISKNFNGLKRDPDKHNFQSVIFHEVGHVLGFVSGVNVLDYFYGKHGPTLPHKEFEHFSTPLDFARCSLESASVGADMDWTVSDKEKHFAIDAKCAGKYKLDNAWSRGVSHGDGYEAGHWRVNSGLGVMMPTSQFDLKVSSYDLFALDVIGWDLAP